MNFLKKLTPFTLPLLLVACGDDDLDTSGIQAPNAYEFSSLTDPSAPSSVDYRVATTQLALIKELEYLIGSDELQAYGQGKDRAIVIELLNRVYEGGTKTSFNKNLTEVNLYDDLSTPTPVKGIVIGDGTLTFATSSFAENTNIKETVSLATDEQIQDWFFNIATLATDDDNTTRFTSNGFNYQALVIGYLSVAMPFDRASNTHLNATGLGANNTRDNSNLSFTQLEHNWDLAFGYFGTSQLAKTQSLDSIITNNQNGVSRLNNYVFDVAEATAQRDLDSTLREANFSQSIINDFLNGRAIISLDKDHASFDKQTSLIGNHADNILYNWEKALAATLIYHTKNTIIKRYTIDEYDFHWAMMTVYAQAIAMSPNSLLASEDIAILTANKLDASDTNKQTNYLTTLYVAEQNIKQTYGFSESDVASWK